VSPFSEDAGRATGAPGLGRSRSLADQQRLRRQAVRAGPVAETMTRTFQLRIARPRDVYSQSASFRNRAIKPSDRSTFRSATTASPVFIWRVRAMPSFARLATLASEIHKPRLREGEVARHCGAPPNIVLVHGAWADRSSWRSVIERLQDDGFHVCAPQFPLASLVSDVARLRQVLEFQVRIVTGMSLRVGAAHAVRHRVQQSSDRLSKRSPRNGK
jgi:hypothetical protein